MPAVQTRVSAPAAQHRLTAPSRQSHHASDQTESWMLRLLKYLWWGYAPPPIPPVPDSSSSAGPTARGA